MSGSESPAVRSSGRDGFSLRSTTETEHVTQNIRVAFSSDGYQPITPPSTSPNYPPPINAVPTAVGESAKKKRGRPRKYGPDASISLPLPSQSPPPTGFSSPPLQGNSTLANASVPPGDGSSMKKARGRPPGSLNKRHNHQFHGRGPVGFGFTPHVITIRPGEDISSKLMSFSQHGRRSLCILSANGAISNVTLRQDTSSGGTVTYEGRFEILSLTGSFTLSEHGGQRSRGGALTISLSGPDGRILGGGVAGLLIAASPVQVVLGSFVAEGKKKPNPVSEVDPSGTAKLGQSGSTGASSPQSRGTVS